MGLVPSRESLYETPGAASQPRVLPFISRAAENYMYKTNRTERVFGTDVAYGLTGGVAVPAALLNGMPTAELAHKVIEADQNAVYIDDPAEATAAVAASRGGRRGSAKSADAPCRGRSTCSPPLEAPAAEALRQGKTLYVYYYEHRVLPLTAEYFPSPDCVLFRQLWHARQHQNPRYHFQLDHTWSPGALTDPTAAYESFSELAAHNMTDIQAACLSAGYPVTKESLAQAQVQLQEAVRALNGSDLSMRRGAVTSPESPRTRVPFATREEFYNLVVRTTKESVKFDTDQELRDAVCGSAAPGKAASSHGSKVGEGLAAEGSSKAERERHRLRPVPCAIVLVRRCMPAHEYRYTYYIAHNERHHKAGAGSSSRRRGPTNACGAGEAQQQQRELHSTLVCDGSVRTAVDESHLVDRSRQCKVGDDEVTVPWVQVSVPQAPLGLAELRVVGMYGCWTVEEILRHTLFAPAVSVSCDCDGTAGAAATQKSPSREAEMEEVLRRAAPHGVPSSTLVNTAFFEKQVGDKEQCHTYFALCRLFAHELRRCVLGDMSYKAAATSAGGHSGPVHASTDGELSGEHLQQTAEAAAERRRADPAWQALMDVLSGGSSAMSTLGDLANCFIIRFSNIPQLQLCRQIRCMLTELHGIYPTPPTLEDFQAAQRQRNMAAMSKKADARNDAGNDAAQGGWHDASGSSPLKGSNGGEGFTAPPTLQGSHESVRADNTDALPSAASERDGNRQPEATAAAKRDGKPAALPLSLDPEAIAGRPHQMSEKERLERVGFCCYASCGLVVFRLSRVAVARALNQLSFSPLHDSVEALCVTLTAAAPPPLTYRGELRPPARLRAHAISAAAAEACGTGEQVQDGDEEERGGAVASAETHSSEALENMYNNALRYSSAAGFSMEPLWPMQRDKTSWATHATALEETPDELIGVLPRNSIEQRRGRLLPLRGVVVPEGATTASNGARNRGVTHHGRCSGTVARQQHHQQRHNQSSSSTPSSVLFQADVYTVSAELDGMAFRELVELAHQEQQRGWQSTACGASEENTPRLLIGPVDAHGNVEPDSVLNWSPMAALGSLRWKRALAAAGCEKGGSSGDRDDAAADMAAIQSAPEQSPSAPGSQGAVSIFVHEPGRVLRAGDRVRFAPYCGGSPKLREDSSSKDTSGSGTSNSRSHSGGDATSGTSRYGYWYVDDNLTTEDLILSWMRRVGSRARESCGTDTKWVRFPEPVLQVLLRFAHACRQQPGGGWLTTGQALHPLHPADEELVEPDLLQNYPDILRTRRFRQWRFSHDGYVYFHGVTVRIPGSMPLLSHAPHAAAMTASAYHVSIHSGREAAAGMASGRRPGMAAVPNECVTPEPLQQQRHPAAQQYYPVVQYGERPPSLPILQHSCSGGVDGGLYNAGTSIGGPVCYANQAKLYPIMGGNTGGGGGVPATHYDPSMASQQPQPYLSAVPRQQRLSQRMPQQYLPHQFPEERPYGSGAPLHCAMQGQQMMLQPPQPQPQHKGSGCGLARPHSVSGAGYDPHRAPSGRSSMGGGCEEEAIAAGYCGRSLPIAAGGAGGAGPATPDASSALYFHGADLVQSKIASTTVGSGDHQRERRSIGYRSHRVDEASSSKGAPSGGAGLFADAADGVSFRSTERAHSNAPVMGPAHVTSSFYGDICSPSAQQLPHTPQQQSQRLRSQTLSPSAASVPASGQASGAWHMGSSLLSYGSPPDVSGAVPPSQEVPNPSKTAAGGGQSQEEAARSPSAPSMMHAASGNQQHQCHHQQQPLTPMLPSPSVPAPPPQQPVSHSFHGEGDRVGYAAERRTTHDYPPRRSHHNAILATTSLAAPAVKPALQKLSVHALRGTHSVGGHRAPPVASFAPDVVDPSPLSASGGNTRPAVMTKDRAIESVDSGGDFGSDSRQSIQPLRVLNAPVFHPDESANAQHMRHVAPQVYRHPQQQQQEYPQQTHVPPPRSPQIASNSGSFRDTVTADVIEADSITVRVMQRKPSLARQSSYSGATGGALAGGYRTGSSALGSSSNAAGGEGGAPETSPSPMGYGAMGVSPSGGLETMRDEASCIHRKTSGVLASDGRAALEYRSYCTPQVVIPTAGQQLSSGRSTAGAFAAPQSQRQSSRMESSSSAQRMGQRISHNPYNNARSLSVTSLPAAAVCSAYSQGGADGGRVGSNGPHDFLADALDNRYSSASDFNASASSPVGLGHHANGMAHDTFHTRGGGDPAAFRSSPTTSQRPSGSPSQRAAGGVGDFSRTDPLREGQHESCASFYEAAGDVQTSAHYSDFYQNAAADGTTQGFFFSMGDYEDSGNSAQELYGSTPHYQYQDGQARPVHGQGHTDKGTGCAGSAYEGFPMPNRCMFHQQPPQRNVGGSPAYSGGVCEDGTPAYALSRFPQLPPPLPPHTYGLTPTGFQSDGVEKFGS
ncbi:hypothetical protein GH5_01481 [Leishmania sp. Ghana 2012 LV757]|uniref:hypothetical protein n=1 Tax=Leishmania sp. Ghana 2012 LV757 TaxID=2803181 RepID=UPI001B42F980|nr:hypothetical protein GH5_01481 [Leishmania sp. Ghana 2012 LV757]